MTLSAQIIRPEELGHLKSSLAGRGNPTHGGLVDASGALGSAHSDFSFSLHKTGAQGERNTPAVCTPVKEEERHEGTMALRTGSPRLP